MEILFVWNIHHDGVSFLRYFDSNIDNIPFFSFATNKQLIFVPLIQIVSLVVSSVLVFKGNYSAYKFSFVWGAGVIITSIMIFKHC